MRKSLEHTYGGRMCSHHHMRARHPPQVVPCFQRKWAQGSLVPNLADRLSAMQSTTDLACSMFVGHSDFITDIGIQRETYTEVEDVHPYNCYESLWTLHAVISFVRLSALPQMIVPALVIENFPSSHN